MRLAKRLCLIVFLMLTGSVWSEIQLAFTPMLAATYTSNSNIFSERKDVRAATSYELIPSARLTAVFGNRFRSSLLYRYSVSQYMNPGKESLMDEAENKGLDRESVVEYRNSAIVSATEYWLTKKIGFDLAARYDVSGLPSEEATYYNRLGFNPGFWFNPAQTTAFHCNYIYNRFSYPFNDIPDESIRQVDQEDGGAITLLQEIFEPTRIGLTYQYSRNNSNDDLWDYKSSDEFINIWQNFGGHVSLQLTGHLRQRLYAEYLVVDSDEKRLDNFMGIYNYLTVIINKYLSLNFGYDSLNNLSNNDDTSYVKSFVYGGITIIPGSFTARF